MFDDDSDDLVVQGYTTNAVAVPAGEAAVRVPKAVILAAADALRAETTA